MGQHDILIWLYQQRMAGDETYYTVHQIAKALKDQLQSNSYKTVHPQIMMLWRFGFVEVKTAQKWGLFSDGKVWKRKYRIEKKHYETAEKLLRRDKLFIVTTEEECQKRNQVTNI